MTATLSDVLSQGIPADPYPTWDANGVYMRSDYFIAWDRLNSYPKLCEWITHLSYKNWVTPAMLRELVFSVEKHFRWPHHYNA